MRPEVARLRHANRLGRYLFIGVDPEVTGGRSERRERPGTDIALDSFHYSLGPLREVGREVRRSALADVPSRAFLTCYCHRISHRCAMTGIAEWLASIGLGEYAQRFDENVGENPQEDRAGRSRGCCNTRSSDWPSCPENNRTRTRRSDRGYGSVMRRMTS